MRISSGSQRGLGQMWSCGPERPAKTDYALDQASQPVGREMFRGNLNIF